MAGGGVTGAIGATRQLFAESATFRTLTDSDNATEALAHIFRGRASDEAADVEEAPPRLIVIPLPLVFRAESGHFTMNAPEVLVSLDHAPSSPSSYTDSDFYAHIEEINKEVMALMNTNGHLVVTGFTLFLTGKIPPEQNNGNHWWRADWLLTIGGLP